MMPRYLDINYLSETFIERRQFLNQSILTVPHHLEYVGSYSHCGKLSDHVYRGPWNRAKPDDEYLLCEKACVDSDLYWLIQDSKQPGLETINWKDSFSEELALYDVVPSSNPGSQESLPDFVLLDAMDDTILSTNTSDSTFKETFEQIHLPKGSSHQSSGYIEELVLREPFSDFLLNLPALHSMLKFLKQKTVKDPFIDQDEQPLDDGVLIVQDGQYEEISEPADTHTKIHFSDREQFDKFSLLQEEELLEEIICSSGLPTLDRPNTVEQLKSSLTVDSDENLKAPVSPKLEQELKIGDAKNICDNLETAKFSPSEDKVEKSFLDINGGKIYNKVEEVEGLLMESPLERTDEADSSEEGSLTKGLLCELKPLETSDNSELTILTANSKDALHDSHWKEERYFNDILVLRLTEPVTSKSDVCEESVTKEALQAVSAVKQQNVTEEELALPWDPFIHSRPPIPSIEGLQSGLEKSHKSAGAVVEPLEKYQDALLYDWQDSFLELSMENRGFGCLKAVILARRKTATRVSSKVVLPTAMKTAGLNIAVAKPTRSLVMPSSSDPLSDFLMMRSADLPHTATPSKKPVQQEKISLISNVEGKVSPPDKLRRKHKSKILTMKLTGDYTKASGLMLEYGAHFLQPLQGEGILSNYQNLDAIPPDMTRFLLKQMEKQGGASTEPGTDTRRNLLALHVLSCAFDTLVHCSLESAISCLSAMQEKHQQEIGNCLVDVRQKLFQLQCDFQARHVYHPKMTEMCKYIEEWLKHKRAKDPDLEPKVLVVVRRDLGSLQNRVRQVLATVSHLTPVVQSENGSLAILEKLDKHSCVVVEGQSIEEDFPWSQFSLVLEYEHQQSTSWHHTCLRQNIRYLGLTMETDTARHDDSHTYLPVINNSSNPENQHIYIGSHKLTSNSVLLQLLETRFNTVIVERDYGRLTPALTSLHFADITMDERTGVVLYTMEDMEEDWRLESLLTQLVSLHLKYSQCWLLLAPTSTEKTAKSPEQKRCFSNLAKLQASIANFSSTAEDFQVKIVTCKDSTELAHVINRIGEQLQDNNPSSQSWLTTNLLAENRTNDEKFLMMFPCVNTISAQMMLKTAALKELFIMPLNQLKSMFPFLPHKVLKTFHHLVNSNSGLNLRASSSDSLNTDTSDCPDVDTPKLRRSDTSQHEPSYPPQALRRPPDSNHVEVARLVNPIPNSTAENPHRNITLSMPQMRGEYLQEIPCSASGSTGGQSGLVLADSVSIYHDSSNPNMLHNRYNEGACPDRSTDGIDASPGKMFELSRRIVGRDSYGGVRNSLSRPLDELQSRMLASCPKESDHLGQSRPHVPSIVERFEEQDSLEYNSQVERPNEFTLAELEGQIAAEQHRTVTGLKANPTDISEQQVQYRSNCHSLVPSHSLERSQDRYTIRPELLGRHEIMAGRPLSNTYEQKPIRSSAQYYTRGLHPNDDPWVPLDGSSSYGTHRYADSGLMSNIDVGFQHPLPNEQHYLDEFIASQNSGISVERKCGGESSGYLSQWQSSLQPRLRLPSPVPEYPHYVRNNMANRIGPDYDQMPNISLPTRYDRHAGLQKPEHYPAGFSTHRYDTTSWSRKPLPLLSDSRSLLPSSQSRYHHPTWDAYPRPPIHRVSIGLAQPQPRNPPQADIVEDSPPMDLDSEDSQDQRRMQDNKYLHTVNTFKGGDQNSGQPMRSMLPQGMSHSRPEGQSGRPAYPCSTDEPALLSLVPVKRKCLGLEKVPGSKGGQTRLTFS